MTRSAFWGMRRWAPALLALACLGCAAPARAQFFPFGAQSAPRPEPVPQQLTAGQVRAVLAREGARMLGLPRRRGPDIIAFGRDEDGDRKRFTLDAITGEILDITVIARHEDRPPPPPADDLGAPLPPPDHAPHDGSPGADAPPAGGAPSRAISTSPLAPPAPAEAGAGASAQAPRSANPADSALSPIKPLKPAGAPKVEPLPK